MLAADYLKYYLALLKVTGYRWDVEKLQWFHIAYCIFFISRKSYDLYFLYLAFVAVPSKNVDLMFLMLLQNISNTSNTFVNIASVLSSLFYRRNVRKHLFEKIDDWKLFLHDHANLIEREFKKGRFVSVITTFILWTGIAAFRILMTWRTVSSPRYKFTLMSLYVNIVGLFDHTFNLLQPRIYGDFIDVVTLPFRVTNKLAEQHKLTGQQLREIHASLSGNIVLLNQSLGVSIFLEIFKFFIVMVGYIFYFSQSVTSNTVGITFKAFALTFSGFIPCVLAFLLIFVSANSLMNEVRKT